MHIHTQLVALLREVKYLEQRESTDHVIPESAATVFTQSETYRKFLQVHSTVFVDLAELLALLIKSNYQIW